MNWPETKSAICNNANDTVITLLNYAWIRTKLDTYTDSITENFAIVNPFAGKEHFTVAGKEHFTVFSAKTPYTAEESAPVRCARHYSRPT